MALGPCPSCRRHVLVSETSCPFCGAPVQARATPAASVRLSRAALFAFTAMATVGCPNEKRDPETIVQPYGAPPRPPPPDTGVTDADPNATPTPPPAPVYGGPPPNP